MSINTVRDFLFYGLLIPSCFGLQTAHSGEPPRVKIRIERVERVSREEAHFRLKVRNPSNRPVFLNGIKYDSERHLYPVYLEQWRSAPPSCEDVRARA